MAGPERTIFLTGRFKKLLLQVRPANTDNAFYVGETNFRTTVTVIYACSGATGANVRVLHDEAAAMVATVAAADQDHAILWDFVIAANTTRELITSGTDDSGIIIQPGGQLGVRASAANIITFSIYGYLEQDI
jgi:hypothetical protein